MQCTSVFGDYHACAIGINPKHESESQVTSLAFQVHLVQRYQLTNKQTNKQTMNICNETYWTAVQQIDAVFCRHIQTVMTEHA